MKKIKVTIAPDGKISTVVEGIAGAGCGAATKFIEQLGAVTEDHHTDEYYQGTGTGIETALAVGGGW